MIYCSFCCIYVWLDPGTYMIARFMFFYKPGVTESRSPSTWTTTRRRFSRQHHQQLDDSFDYSNSDLHSVINIGRNVKIVIINKGEEHEDVKAYSPTSNYRLPDNYGYNSRKRRNEKAIPPPQPTKQSKIDSTHQKLHSRCFLHPKGKHSSFQCIILRKALRAPPPFADKDKKNQQEQNLFWQSKKKELVGWVQPPQGQPPVLHPIKARMGLPEGGSTPELSTKTR